MTNRRVAHANAPRFNHEENCHGGNGTQSPDRVREGGASRSEEETGARRTATRRTAPKAPPGRAFIAVPARMIERMIGALEANTAAMQALKPTRRTTRKRTTRVLSSSPSAVAQRDRRARAQQRGEGGNGAGRHESRGTQASA